jgi:hypothetical protein
VTSISVASIHFLSSRPAKRVPNVAHRKRSTKRIAQRVGCVLDLHTVGIGHGALFTSVFSHHNQVRYFNMRRVLGEQQKEVLAAVEKQRLEAQEKGFR